MPAPLPKAPVGGTPSSAKYGGVTPPKIISSANPATHVILAMTVQIGGLLIVTMIAGMSEGAGNTMILLMLALFLLFAIMNVDKFKGIVDILTNVEQGAA